MNHKEYAEKVWDAAYEAMWTTDDGRDASIAIIAAALAAEYRQGAEDARDVAVEVLAYVSGDTIASAIGDVEDAVARLLETKE